MLLNPEVLHKIAPPVGSLFSADTFHPFNPYNVYLLDNLSENQVLTFDSEIVACAFINKSNSTRWNDGYVWFNNEGTRLGRYVAADIALVQAPAAGGWSPNLSNNNKTITVPYVGYAVKGIGIVVTK